eukprot:446867_1
MEGFYGFEVQAGKDVKPKIPAENVLRVTQIALPANANGAVSVTVTYDGRTFAVGTLDAKASLFQISTDLIFGENQTVTFSAKGAGSVHVTGYLQPTADDEGMGDDMDMDDEEDDMSDDEEMDEDEEEEVFQQKKPVAKKAAKAAPVADEEDEEDDEEMSDDEEMDEDDEEDLDDEEMDEDDEEMDE